MSGPMNYPEEQIALSELYKECPWLKRKKFVRVYNEEKRKWEDVFVSETKDGIMKKEKNGSIYAMTNKTEKVIKEMNENKETKALTPITKPNHKPYKSIVKKFPLAYAGEKLFNVEELNQYMKKDYEGYPVIVTDNYGGKKFTINWDGTSIILKDDNGIKIPYKDPKFYNLSTLFFNNFVEDFTLVSERLSGVHFTLQCELLKNEFVRDYTFFENKKSFGIVVTDYTSILIGLISKIFKR